MIKVKKGFDFNANNKFALTKNELERLENLDLSHQPQYEFYRDLFLLQTYLCLRYSELRFVNSDSMSGNEIRLYDKKK